MYDDPRIAHSFLSIISDPLDTLGRMKFLTGKERLEVKNRRFLTIYVRQRRLNCLSPTAGVGSIENWKPWCFFTDLGESFFTRAPVLKICQKTSADMKRILNKRSYPTIWEGRCRQTVDQNMFIKTIMFGRDKRSCMIKLQRKTPKLFEIRSKVRWKPLY